MYDLFWVRILVDRAVAYVRGVAASVRQRLVRTFKRKPKTGVTRDSGIQSVRDSQSEGMKIGHVDDLLKSLGWQLSRDTGIRIGTYRLSDRYISLIYGIRNLTDQQKLWLTPSVRTRAFSTACATVEPGYGESAPFIRLLESIDISAPELHEQHVRQASDTVITWAQEQDLNKALIEHAVISTNSAGASPIWHLAALALIRELGRLSSYLESFDAGDRLGFVNYVSRDHVDRALQFAESRTGSKLYGSRRRRQPVTAWQDEIVEALGATARPSGFGGAAWAAVEAEIGCALPAGFKVLIDRLGAGCIGGSIWLPAPFHENKDLDTAVVAKNAMCSYSRLHEHHPVYYPRLSPPEDGAAVAFARTDSGDYLSFICEPGDPDNWAVAICHKGIFYDEILAGDVAEFFYAFVENRVRSIVLPPDFFDLEMKFETHDT